MAIYHLETKIISRSIGRSVVAAAAYMSCSRLYNDYDGTDHDYTRKHGLVHQEVMLPPQAPQEWMDREKLWNAVEDAEKSKDSRLAREFVAALPIELSKEEWIELLRQYIHDYFVSDGMCADFSIHDTDGHNPHAHIILTVRPLNENGKWQHKTEKEYLCIRNGEEKGFTAAEFKAAQNGGWEKQYKYKVGKKKIYMAPSKADRQGYERVSKYPKSKKFGKQNPITERWSSEAQLIKWREAWADVTNRILEEKGIAERIDPRSSKDRGITEQPTIHEGVSSQFMEKQGTVLERRELNRQIKDDNRLLRKLKSEYEEMAAAAKSSIPEIAMAMETVFANLIVCRYNQMQAKKVAASYGEWLDAIKPDYQKYTGLKKEIKSKKSKLCSLEAERKAVSKLNFIRQASLSKEASTLTEDIGELESELANFLLYYGSETEFKKLCAIIPAYEEKKKKQTDLQSTFEKRIASQTKDFYSLMDNVLPGKETALKAERGALHPNTILQAREHLQKAYKNKFNYRQFSDAKSYISDSLNEAEQEHTLRHKLIQAREQSKPAKQSTHKNKDFIR